MDRYDFPTPRFACGIAAAAMTAMTITMLVVLPSAREPESKTFATLTAEAFATTRCDSDSGCAKMAESRRSNTTPVHFQMSEPKCKEEG